MQYARLKNSIASILNQCGVKMCEEGVIDVLMEVTKSYFTMFGQSLKENQQLPQNDCIEKLIVSSCAELGQSLSINLPGESKPPETE